MDSYTREMVATQNSSFETKLECIAWGSGTGLGNLVPRVSLLSAPKSERETLGTRLWTGLFECDRK